MANNSIDSKALLKMQEELRLNPLNLPDKEYDVVVIDPPWPMRKSRRKARPEQFGFDYPTMTVNEIQALDIQSICTENSWIFLWTTQRFLPFAFNMFENWDIRYRYTMTWYKSGGFQIWNYPQFNTEFVLCGTYGKPQYASTKAFSTGFTAPRRGHSVKPEEFYDTITRVCGEVDRLDMFSRNYRKGWDVWGNEV